MRILCCLDGRNATQLHRTQALLSHTGETICGLLYVIDTEPRGEIERQRERFLRASLPRQARIEETERLTAQEILDEGAQLFAQTSHIDTISRQGKPEREIVACAHEWRADLVLVCRRTPLSNEPDNGPKSVGHVARFVLDHAPCEVLLIRSL